MEIVTAIVILGGLGLIFGRVLAAATVACPPAVPVVVSGEVIGPDALEIFRYYGIREVSVMKEQA